MTTVTLLSDIPAERRPTVRVVDTNSAWFKAEIARVKAEKGPVASACDVKVPVEVK